MSEYFEYNEKRCIGCQSCQVACKQFHDIKAGTISYRKVSGTPKGVYPDVTRTFLSISCEHCANPLCVNACPVSPVKALSKRAEDGIVVVDQSKCIGCGACGRACPFGAPNYITVNGKRVMQKCDFCLSLDLEDGAQTRCAAACTTQALRNGSLRNG